MWVGGDVTVLVALDGVISAAKKAGIPVFTNIPPSAQRGALFDFGANHEEIGRLTGELAANILQGADPAAIPVKNVVPEMFIVNPGALAGLRQPWRLPEEVRRRADAVVEGTSLKRTARAIRSPAVGRMYKVGIAYFGPDPGVDAGMQGLLDGLKEFGFVEGKNLQLKKAHAQGEMGNIPSILQNYANQDLDLIVPMTTPLLTGTIGLVKKTPAVFTVVYDPIAAGAGPTRDNHVPNVTGVGSFPPIADTVQLIRDLVPGIRTVGTVYNSSEANSRKVIEVARDEFRRRGIKLEEVAITNTSEVFQAAQVLTARNIQAFWITGDNTVLQAFEGVVKVADDHRLPLIINDPEFTDRGALACAGLGFYQSGHAAAALAARVMLGEDPRHIPIEEVAVKKLVLNEQVARKLGLTFSAALRKEASNEFPMQITKVQRGEFVEVRISGRLDGYWADHLTTGLAEVVREGGHQIRVNLSEVSFLSSAGIRVLVQFFKQLRAIDGSLAVCNPSEHVSQVLDLAGLRGLLISTDDAAPAVVSTAPSAVRRRGSRNGRRWTCFRSQATGR